MFSYCDLFQTLKREIEQRIEQIPKIVYEPKLMTACQDDNHSKYILPPTESKNKPLPAHYYRMKAVDDVKKLGNYRLNLVDV